MAGHYASPGWSDLPIDLLIDVLQLLELPEALAFRAVCPSWRSASTAAKGVPRTRRTPWLVSLATGQPSHRFWDPTASSKFRNLLDENTFQVSYPWGEAVALCGASHGWLVVVNELADLVLYHPFTMTTVPLPPITGFSSCVEGVYGDDGNVVAYRYASDLRKRWDKEGVFDMDYFGRHFCDKVVLSGSPSLGAIALAIHLDGSFLSFARVGDGTWQQVWEFVKLSGDSFVDCIHHRGMFYTVTMQGALMSWDFGGSHNPKSETIVAADDNNSLDVLLLTRYLVSTPWGHLLQVRVIAHKREVDRVGIKIDRLDLKRRKVVGLTLAKALRGHTVFLGQNSSAVLSSNEFPELRSDCVYFTTPRVRNDGTFGYLYKHLSGVMFYDLKKRTVETAFKSGGDIYGRFYPSEVWFTPSL